VTENANVLLDEIEFKVSVTSIAVNPPCLNDVRSLAVNVNFRSGFLALARLYELWRDSKV